MDNLTDKYNRVMCPKCGKPLPFSVVRNGDAVISIHCRKCKSVSQIDLTRK
jgi:phage FluMu protein Com